MEMNRPVTNGIPDNFETLTREQLKEYRIIYGHYLSPTTILRLLEPQAYFAGLIWELEELLKDKHQNLKSCYKYHSNDNIYYSNNSNVEAEQMRLSEKETFEEFSVEEIKQLFLQHRNRMFSDKQLHTYNPLKPISSPVSQVQETDAAQTFINFNCQQNKQSVHTSTTAEVVSRDEVTKHGEEQNTVIQNDGNQDSLKFRKEASQEGTQQASCSDTQNTYSPHSNNTENGIGTGKIISGFHDKCNEYAYKNMPIGSTKTCRPQNEYTDNLSQNTAVKAEQCKLTEQQNFDNNSDKGKVISLVLCNEDNINGSSTILNYSGDSSETDVSYFIQGIYQAPVPPAPTYSVILPETF